MMSCKLSIRILAATLLVALVANSSHAAPSGGQVIDGKRHTLGKRDAEEKQEHPRHDVRFNSTENAAEATVRVKHKGVCQPWFVEINGKRIGQLPPSYHDVDQVYLAIPAHALVNGTNTVSVVGEDFGREISVSEITLFNKPLRDLLQLHAITITVTDEATGKPVPARVSILDKGQQPELFSVSNTNAAVRDGLIYTDGTALALEIPEGSYEFFASRGMEWSLARKTVTVSHAAPVRVDLRIRREVDTRGFVAADTHIHNVTYSGHGDATVRERMLTLAGEGVEFAVATDHNHHTDYKPFQTDLGLNQYFTPLTGNEVTTKNGHFIAFPMPLGGAVPDHRETDWVKLLADMRAKGAQAVIWNHPYFPSMEENPFVKYGFNHVSGDSFNGPDFTFNAVEVVNSGSGSLVARKEYDIDQTRILTDWFAMINHGERITAAGSSDSHTVDAPVGQGRTYIRSSTDDAAQINPDEMVRNYLAGDTSVGYGIFAEATVNGKQHMGEMVRVTNGKVDVDIHVASASWVKPRRAIVFLNGLPVAEKKLQPEANRPFDQHVKFSVAAPGHDAHLVCAVFGDGVTPNFWRMLGKFTAAFTNPLYLDGDGDGKYQSPRATAEKMLATTDGTLKGVWPVIEKADDTLAGQMLGILYRKHDADFVRQLDTRVTAAAAQRDVYQRFLINSPLVVVKTTPVKKKGKSAASSSE